MILWLSAALAGSTVFGSDFAPAVILGVPNPDVPGSLSVIATDAEVTCDEAAGMQTDPAVKKRMDELKPTIVILAFDSAQAGTEAVQVVIGNDKKMAIGASGAKLGEVSGKGGTLEVKVELDAMGGGKAALDDTWDFELCGPVGERPSLAGTLFEPHATKVASQKVTVRIPKGWASGGGPMGDSWVAPDGRSSMTFSSSPQWDGISDWVQGQVGAFQGNGWSAEVVRSEAVEPNRAWVVVWKNRYGEGPWQQYLEVYVVPDEGQGVKCAVKGDDVTADEVFASAEKACRAIEFSP